MKLTQTTTTLASIQIPRSTWDEIVGANAAIVTDGHDQRIAVHVTSCGCVSLVHQDWRRDPLQVLHLSNDEAIDLARALLNARAKSLELKEIAPTEVGAS